MQRKIKLIQVICLQMEKTTEAKAHKVNLRLPLSRIHYYQSQTVTSCLFLGPLKDNWINLVN